MNGTRDSLTHLLARLPDANPDAMRSARVTARSHAALRRRTTAATSPPRRRLESLCVAGLCLAYLVTVIQQALH